MVIHLINEQGPKFYPDVTKGVKVYMNLSNGHWSVLGYHPEKKGWRIIGHLKSLLAIGDVTFPVNQNGRDRVLREKKKYVHAFVHCSNILFPNKDNTDKGWIGDQKSLFDNPVQVSYNPFKGPKFFVITNPEITVDGSKGAVMLISKHVPGFDKPLVVADNPYSLVR